MARAGGLVLGEALFGGGAVLAGGLEAGLERLLAIGLFREAALGLAGGGVEPLQGDQAFQVGVHHKQKSPGARAPGL